MLKTLWKAVVALLIIHVLALAGLLTWLWQSGRLDEARVHRIVDMLKTTVAQETAKDAAAKAAAQQAQAAAENAQRLMGLGQATLLGGNQLATDARDREIFRQQVERMEREKQDLMRQIQVAQDTLTKQKADFEAQQAAFQKAVEVEVKRRSDRDFLQAVQMYEQLKASQVKAMFQDLIQQNQVHQVVDYLAAMQVRKAAAVLKQFTTPQEIVQATDLVQRLRTRGVDVLGQTGASAPASAAGQTSKPGGSS